MSGSWLTFKKVAVSRLSDLAICRSLYIYNLHHSKLLNWGWTFSFLFWFFFSPLPSQAVYFIINNKLWCHGVYTSIYTDQFLSMNFKIFILSETRGDVTPAWYLGNCPGHSVQSIFYLIFLKWNIGADLSFDSLSGTCVDVCSRSPWSCDF